MDRQAFCNPVHSESPNISDSLSTTTLLNMLQIETPKFAVKIRGEVLQVKPWPNKDTPIYLYGEIGDSQSCIEFKIKPNTKLQLQGQHIEIVGILHTSSNYQRDGIKISIEGEMVNEYKVEYLPTKILANDTTRAKLSLKHFLTQYNFNQLCILSTRQGFADFIAKTNQTVHYTDVVLSVCNFDTTENIINGIKEASSNENIKGIAIIHDGVNCWDNRKWDDTDVVMELLSTNLHIYTALCETDNLLLADKHSDEAFVTPNSFARHLTTLVIENRQKNALSEKMSNIENKFTNIQESRSKLRRLVTLLIISNIALLTAFLIKQGLFF